MFLVTDADGRWHPGIGDPTLMGWLTVVAYFLTTWLCFRAAGVAARSGFTQRLRLATYWFGLTLLLAFLGVNKQLDLQSLFTEVARDLALADGWYEQRRKYQLAFILSMGFAAVFVTAAAFYWLRRQLRRLGDGLVGVGLLLGFVAIRAASFHHVDEWLSVELLGLRFNWIMELGAIALIARSAIRFGGPLRPHMPAIRKRRRNSLGREEIPIKVHIRPASGDQEPKS